MSVSGVLSYRLMSALLDELLQEKVLSALHVGLCDSDAS